MAAASIPADPKTVLGPPLLIEADTALQRGGRVVFLIGPPGSGKTEAVRQLKQQVAQRAGIQIIETVCDGKGQLWANVAARLTRRARVLAMLRRILVTWLGVLPLIGPLIGAISETIRSLRGKKSKQTAQPSTPARQVIELLAADLLHPRCILIDRFENATVQDLAGAAALVHMLETTRTLLVLSVRSSSTSRAHDTIEDLILETERRRLGTCYRLRPRASSDGDAGLVTSEAFDRLPAEDRQLLRDAAMVGSTFDSAVLAELLGVDELSLEDDFARLCRAEVLRAEALPEGVRALTSRYSFVHRPDADSLLRGVPADALRHVAERVANIRVKLGLMDSA